ncbi:unnamed protein product [Lampetra planeri]
MQGAETHAVAALATTSLRTVPKPAWLAMLADCVTVISVSVHTRVACPCTGLEVPSGTRGAWRDELPSR